MYCSAKCSRAIDVLLGIVLVWSVSAFFGCDAENLVAEALINFLTSLSVWLKNLVQWLMANPAGLKLNAPLNETVGHFFLYHIHLWRTYIEFVAPTLPRVLFVMKWSSIIGWQLTIAMVRDFVSLMAIHIYCFHVYAARLYQLQITSVVSLWRLFRGKKWNPLRSRVDSVQFDPAQLFLGTILFTILLFLLPTVIVYYFVFTALRACVLLWDKLLSLTSSLGEIFVFAVTKMLGFPLQPTQNISDPCDSHQLNTIQNVLLFMKQFAMGVLI